jgi:hypothetical protein
MPIGGFGVTACIERRPAAVPYGVAGEGEMDMSKAGSA